MHFYPHHIGDFLKDTSSLTPEESYYYLRLIWLYYDTESRSQTIFQALLLRSERVARRIACGVWFRSISHTIQI